MVFDFSIIAQGIVNGVVFIFTPVWHAASLNTPPYPIWYLVAGFLWHNAHSTRSSDAIRFLKILGCGVLVMFPTVAFFAS